MSTNQNTDRREFIKTVGLGTAAGAVLMRLPFVASAAELDPALTPERRAKRLAELMDEHRLFDRGARRVYRGEHLTAISLPVGGIAAGPLQINGEARRPIWQIFRNYPSMAMPNSFFAVRAQAGKAATVVRLLQTVSEGKSFSPMKSLSFSGEYPFGWYTFEEPALPVRVSMEVFSPLIPLNTKDSSIPCAIFNLTAENTGTKPVAVSFLATQRNAIGCLSGYGGCINQMVRENNGVVMHLNSTRAATDGAYGDLVLATTATEAKATASWESEAALAERFHRDGLVMEVPQAGPTPAGQTVDAAIAVPFQLKPGEKRTITFVLTWYFPNTSFKDDRLYAGNMYCNWWPDALGVARDVVGRLDELTQQTRLYNTALYSSNLPYWLLDRISSQVAILSSMTCNWTKDDFFYVWEGCNPSGGCCNGNATHVLGYAHSHARLFPSLARRMREQQYAKQKPDGMIPVRFVLNFPAFDGMCHEISASYREHLTSPDGQWLATHWPAVKKAMDYVIHRWDNDENGMLSGPQHGMDGDHGGTASWLGSTYLCALAAAEQMAALQNDPGSAERYAKIRKAGQANQDQALFNGEYYIQVPDPTPREDYLTGCHVDQMLGQWWAKQLGFGWFYPVEHVRSAMRSLMKYNFRTDFHGIPQLPRKFVADNEAGMQYCTWPRGGRPQKPTCLQNGDEVMTPFEYSVGSLMVDCGLLREAFTLVHATSDRYDGRLRTTQADGLTIGLLNSNNYSNWGFSGNPFGDEECGKFYARALAVWSLLLSCQGFSYDGPAGTIGFEPIWKPEDHVSFFTAAEGWGLFTQKRTGSVQRSRIELQHGRLRVKTLWLAVPNQAKSFQGKVTVNGQPLPATVTVQNNRVTIQLEAETTLQAGKALEIELR